MTDEANDRREGYADGMAGHLRQKRRGKVYRSAWEMGFDDRHRLHWDSLERAA